MQIREVSKEQWVDWRHHPVTKVFFATVADAIQEIQEAAMLEGSNIDIFRGMHQAFKEVQFLEIEETNDSN